jgi:predicted N-acetyltransferase YhbS
MVLHNLRNSSDFIPELSFIAEVDGRIVGHIAYSRGIVKSEDGAEHAVISFGPISVLPAFQKKGTGSALIRHSLGVAKELGCTAICIYGDPRYYGRFGFRCAERYEIKTADGKYAFALMALELQSGALREVSGRFIESSAFEVDEDELMAYDNSFPLKEKAKTDSQRDFQLLVSLRY